MIPFMLMCVLCKCCRAFSSGRCCGAQRNRNSAVSGVPVDPRQAQIDDDERFAQALQESELQMAPPAYTEPPSAPVVPAPPPPVPVAAYTPRPSAPAPQGSD